MRCQHTSTYIYDERGEVVVGAGGRNVNYLNSYKLPRGTYADVQVSC